MGELSYSEQNPIYQQAIVCDMTLPFGEWIEGRPEVLDRFYGSGITFVSLTIGSDEAGTGVTVHNIADVTAMIHARSDRMIIARSVADIRRAKREHKLAVGFHFQGSLALENNPNLIELFYNLGVRHMLLAYNVMNTAAGGCMDQHDVGLSGYGLRLIEEMNRTGMIVDCTHTSYRSTMDIMEASRAPVIFSHSNARRVYEHARNIEDDQALACARRGGVVGVTGVGKFMSAGGESRVQDLMPHILYYVDLIGPEHVALGIDNVYYLEQMYRRVAARPGLWPKGNPPPPWHYVKPEQVPELSEALSKVGMSETHIAGILGENFLRVAEQIWK
ncbi:dipeptidase [Caballeronia sp. LjRoot34]|uniref:dipeptidase n=1 Tax=Caballeronia sp. LjRoot34 TaxID=3342325 RepID=UPI003ECF6490